VVGEVDLKTGHGTVTSRVMPADTQTGRVDLTVAAEAIMNGAMHTGDHRHAVPARHHAMTHTDGPAVAAQINFSTFFCLLFCVYVLL